VWKSSGSLPLLLWYYDTMEVMDTILQIFLNTIVVMGLSVGVLVAIIFLLLISEEK